MEYQILVTGLCIIAWTDVRWRIIPNQVLLILIFARLVLAENAEELLFSLSGFLTGGMIMLAAYRSSGKMMGAGDVKLLAVTGSYAGPDKLLRVLFLSLVLALFSCFCKAIKRKAWMREEIPFAPYVLLGVLCDGLLSV